MYWPIGAPNVYAISKHSSPRTILQSDDGLPHSPEANEASERTTSNETESTDKDRLARPKSISRSTGSQQDTTRSKHVVLSVKLSRGGSLFATLTGSSLTIWQTKPTVALTSVNRSPQSIKAYGPNIGFVWHPNSLLLVVQTTNGYLITYSLATDPNAKVYELELPASARKASASGEGIRRRPSVQVDAGAAEGDGIREVSIRFRMAIRIDAGISNILTLDDEMVVTTVNPAAVQCIKWPGSISDMAKPGAAHTQTQTELVNRMTWFEERSRVVEMVHDRPMNLMVWLASDGRAYAIQRRSPDNVDMDNPAGLFQGYCFRRSDSSNSVKVAINPRFSLIAVGCDDGDIEAYLVKNYLGNIPYSHRMQPVPASSTGTTSHGRLHCLTWSPDGYCLFAGYEKGWVMWSVYGKMLASTSIMQDRKISEANQELYLQGVREAFFSGGGCEILMLSVDDDRLWSLAVARSAVTTCFSSANVQRGLLVSSSNVRLYKGHELDDLTALPSDSSSLWQSIQIPPSYLLHQWPIKCAVVSSDGKYIAVAGRKGLAHYSVLSARWRAFDDPAAEHEFAIRGGMCWFQIYLLACVETTATSAIDGTSRKIYQARAYDRSRPLDGEKAVVWTAELPAAAIWMGLGGSDSLLVYTGDNTLIHYIIVPPNASGNGAATMPSKDFKLIQVGQIGFHGIIRAPPRVRSVSWVLPEEQIEAGDPSMDVATASVIFLVDGKLVLLQPSTNESGELKYDMRVIATNVEWYVLLRDQPAELLTGIEERLGSISFSGNGAVNGSPTREPVFGHSLRDSLWYFDGSVTHVWSDILDVLACAPSELGRDLPPTVQISADFYPLSVMVNKGILSGLDADLVQRRDVDFSLFRLAPRTTLFLPQLLRWHLSEYNSPAALHLARSYEHLAYFPHVLEVLLHDILDAEVDGPPDPPETALLPGAVAFLSSFEHFLDVVVNCTRKTELRSWKTLFENLPPVTELFEQSLTRGKLKTAAGYLLVLHTFEDEVALRSVPEGGPVVAASGFQVHSFARLLRRSAAAKEWELCRELARFLVGIDASGDTLKAALKEAGLGKDAKEERPHTYAPNGNNVPATTFHSREQSNITSKGATGAVDYFSLQRPPHSEIEEGTSDGSSGG